MIAALNQAFENDDDLLASKVLGTVPESILFRVQTDRIEVRDCRGRWHSSMAISTSLREALRDRVAGLEPE